MPALNQWGDRGGISPTDILFTTNLLKAASNLLTANIRRKLQYPKGADTARSDRGL